MSRLAGPFGVIAVVILAVAFASQNGAERVTLDLGLFVLYGVPVTLVAFGGLFVGMLVMLGAGIQSDLKVRAILRHRLAEEDADEPELVDHSQRDLFLHAPPVAPVEAPVEAPEEAPVERLVSPSVEPAPVEPTESDMPPEPWLSDAPSLVDLAPPPEPPTPLDRPAKSPGHPVWRDMEHGDPMD